MKKPSKTLAGYPAFLGEIKHRIQSARHSVARAVNRDLILLYWDIGRAIRERQMQLGWGESVVEALAADLREAFQGATGFSARNLRNMKQFHEAYSSPLFWQQAVAKLAVSPQEAKFWQQPVAKLSLAKRMEFFRQAVADIPWGQHLLILNRISDPTARLYYLRATAQFGWSRNLLLNQIKARSYERSQAKGKVHNFPVALPGALAELAEQALKSSYSLEFLGIKHELRERDLEQRLLERLRGFILELGYGFCFIGNQYRLELGRKEYFIDLLFYHRFLKALVAVELKLGAFEPEHAGKMDFYLNLLNEKERAPDDNLSIGIILCAEKDNLEVEFSLKTKRNPIGVAEYQLVPNLPRELQGKLPSARALRALLRAELPIQSRPKSRVVALKKLPSRRCKTKARHTVSTSR